MNKMPAVILALALSLILAACGAVVQLRDGKQPLSSGENLKLAEIYEAKGEYELALKHYALASQDDAGNPDIHFAAGTLNLRMKRYEEAEGHYTKAISLNPDNAAYFNNRAWLHMETGRLDEAEAGARRALLKDPERRHIYLDTLGMVQLRKDKVKEAEASLSEAASAAPSGDKAGLSEIYAHLLELYQKTGDTEKALRIEEKLRGLK